MEVLKSHVEMQTTHSYLSLHRSFECSAYSIESIRYSGRKLDESETIPGLTGLSPTAETVGH